jgi:hypothetical protein
MVLMHARWARHLISSPEQDAIFGDARCADAGSKEARRLGEDGGGL